MLLRRLHQGLALLVSFILLCPPHLLLAANEGVPAWWAEQQIATPGSSADDFAALNQGQLKNLAAKAAQAMEERLPGGAGAQVRALVASWTPPPPGTNDYAAINQGQLKFIAQPFYDRLIGLGLASAYPWAGSSQSADDYALANLGQAKFLFSFALPESLPHTTIPFFDNFDNQDWASLPYPSPPLVNGWQTVNMGNGGGYHSVSYPYVAGFGINAQLRRTFAPLPENQIITLQFWLKIYPVNQTLTPFFSFNGVELAFQNGDDLLCRSTEGVWQTVPVGKSWWAHNDPMDPDRRSYGFDCLTLEYHQPTHTYSLYWGDHLLVDRRSYTPETGAALLTLGGPVHKGEFFIDDFNLEARKGGLPPLIDRFLDSDGDGIPDYWEYLLGSNPFVADSHTSAPGTSYTYTQRYQAMATGGSDPAGLLDLPNLGGNNSSGGNGSSTNPGYLVTKDSDKDGFTDYQESYFGYKTDDKEDHPPIPRYVVIDLGENQYPSRISSKNGWVLNSSSRWHNGAWEDLISYFKGTDINSSGCVLGRGTLCGDYGWRGYYMNAQGQRSGISAPEFDDDIKFPHPSSQKGMAWGHWFVGEDSVIYNPAGFGGFEPNAPWGESYLLAPFGLSQGPLGTAPGKSPSFPGPTGYHLVDVNSIFGRHGTLIEWIRHSYVTDSHVTPNPSLPLLSNSDPNTEHYPMILLHDVNKDLISVGDFDLYPGWPIWGKNEDVMSLLGVDRANQATGAAYFVNTPVDNDYLIVGKEHAWKRKRQADGSFVDPLDFGSPEKLAALVDWNCGWLDKWNVSGLNDAGYLIGIGYKINQPAKTRGGELIIDFKNPLYSVPIINGSGGVNYVPTSAVAQHGFLMLPGEVRGHLCTTTTTEVLEGTEKVKYFHREVVEIPSQPEGVATEPVNELKIAQWYQPIQKVSFDSDQMQFRETSRFRDPDAFYIRLQAPPPPAGQVHRVRIWTEGPDSTYDDAGIVVDLIDRGNGLYQTKPLYLVSDPTDVEGSKDWPVFKETVKNAQGQEEQQYVRRVLCAQLGGQVKLRYLVLGREEAGPPDRVLDIPAKKVVKMQGYIFKSTGWFSSTYGELKDVEMLLKKAKERYAQCSIRLDGNIATVDVPAGVSLSDKFKLYTELDPDGHSLLTPDFKALINGASSKPDPSNPDKIEKIVDFYYIPYTKDHKVSGWSTPPCSLPAADQAYANKFAVCVDEDFANLANHPEMRSRTYVVGHELLHILLNGIHTNQTNGMSLPGARFLDDFKEYKSLWHGEEGNPEVFQTKRISDKMMFRLRESSFCTDP